MTSLKRIIERADTRSGRAFDFFIQLLIVASLVSFSIETLPGLTEDTRQWLRRFEVFTVMTFTVEYLLRLAVADGRLRFARSFFGMIDLLAILPFYVASGIDLRAIRAVRLLRVVRAFKLVRYSRAVQRFHTAFLLAKEELMLFYSVALLIFYFAAVGIYYFERDAQPEAFASIFHSLWWAVATLTTVGYGDVSPVTAGGKTFTFIILMIGLGIVAIPAGLVAAALSEARRLERADREDGS